MICALCNEDRPGEWFYPLAKPRHIICHRRQLEGRCVRCGNWPEICGHNLPFKERVKAINVDTAWMPNAGSAGTSLKDSA